MSELFTAVAMIVVFYWFFRSPLCRAITDSIRRRHSVESGEEELTERLEEIAGRFTEEVRELRVDVGELAERLDFTERAPSTQNGVETVV